MLIFLLHLLLQSILHFYHIPLHIMKNEKHHHYSKLSCAFLFFSNYSIIASFSLSSSLHSLICIPLSYNILLTCFSRLWFRYCKFVGRFNSSLMCDSNCFLLFFPNKLKLAALLKLDKAISERDF